MYNLKKHFINTSIVFLLVILFCYNNVLASARSKIKQGNSYYNKKQYEKSLERYRDAQMDSPESYPIHFNLGNSLYKMGKHEDAMKEFEKSTYSKDIGLQSKAYYNIANSLYRQGKLPESIMYYKKALELNPDDEDAKYNIEYVQKKIKEQMDNQKDQSEQQQQEQQQKQDSKDNEQEDGEQEKEEQQAQKQEKEKDKDDMSEEDAERILNALEDDEKKAQEQKQKTMRSPGIYVEEDW